MCAFHTPRGRVASLPNRHVGIRPWTGRQELDGLLDVGCDPVANAQPRGLTHAKVLVVGESLDARCVS